MNIKNDFNPIHIKYMTIALDLAKKGIGYTSPNPIVGAVVVKNDQIVGSGYHRKAGGPHAEVFALDEAKELANGATLYVTLEPCNHTGKTPPCTEKILASGISHVVTAMKDPNPNVTGKGNEFLRKFGIIVTEGVCESEAQKANEIFTHNILTKLPFVIVKCASTLDGRIATAIGDSKWISNEESRNFVHELRHSVDAILVGIGTVRKDNPKLTTRLKDRKGKNPIRIILDTNLTISHDAYVLQNDDAQTIIVTGDNIPLEKKSSLESKGIKIVQVPVCDNGIDLAYLMQWAGKNNITSVLIEGGSNIISSAFKARIVNKLYFFYAPKLLAGDGIPITSGDSPKLMQDAINVTNIEVSRFGDDVMIQGYLTI